MERSFKKEIEALKLGEGEIFQGEGILAVTKALLESGVSYVGGYQGSPVSNLLDVMVQAKDYMKELGVHVEACANESSAAAMLGASINYPVRGAVTWKSIVGSNVASDALSHLSSVIELSSMLLDKVSCISKPSPSCNGLLRGLIVKLFDGYIGFFIPASSIQDIRT